KWPWAEKFRLVWHYVAFDLEIISVRSAEDLEELKRRIIEVIDQIESAWETGNFPPRESELCHWCSFQEYCPLKKHQVRLEELPVNEYLNEEGVVLVNKYIEYANRKKEIESELEKLKEAIIAYAEKNGVSRVYGSDFYLTLKKQERFQFPGAGEKERLILENIIKEAGLWERFSALDRYALEKALRSGQVAPDLREKLLAFVRKETQTFLYPGKIEKSSD
ncbi:MAG: hypothetical protein WBI18_00410, partial [Candidatus Saccharicenans sp.]